MKPPRVAAIVLNYNYRRFLPECLSSLESQDHPNLLIIIVDDNSDDDSRHYLREWAGSTQREHILLLKPENRGPAHSMNLAIQSLTDDIDFVGFLDADDIWRQSKLSKQLDAFASQKEDCVLVYSDVISFMDGTAPSYERGRSRSSNNLPSVVDAQVLLSRGSVFALNSCLVRADVLRRMAPVDESMRVTDYQLWLGLIREGSFLRVLNDYFVGAVREHALSMSRVEPNYDDRLRLLGRAPVDRVERRSARTRGRGLLKSSLLNRRRTPIRTYWEYGSGARDPLAFVACFFSLIPFRWVIARRLWNLRNRALRGVGNAK